MVERNDNNSILIHDMHVEYVLVITHILIYLE